MVDKLYATNNYTFITYDIVQQGERNILKLDVTENDTRFFLKFGLHYDPVFKTGLLVNATAKRLLFRNSTISLDAVVGDKPRYYFNYFIDNGYIPGFGVYASGMSLEMQNDDGDVIQKRNWFRNEAFIQSTFRDKYAIGGGLSHDYYEAKQIVDLHDVTGVHFINPYVFLKSDTQDDKDFPSRGIYLNAEGKLLDIFNDDLDKKPFQVKGDVRLNIPVASTLTYQLKVFGGFTFGDTLSPYYRYEAGGIFEQNLNNMVSMPGYEFGSKSGDDLLLVSNSLQLRIQKNFFVVGNVTLANMFNDIRFEDVANITHSSAGLTAGYKSPFGQIKLNYSKAFTKGQKGIFSAVLGHWF